MNESLTPKEAREILKFSDSTLRRWGEEGKISFTQHGKLGHRRYNITDLIGKGKKEGGLNICYCRVSSYDQKGDLERQIQHMREKFPDHTIIKDYGSGLNFKRKGLKTILDHSFKGNLQEVVVTHKDRLCRFGYDLLQYVFEETSGAKIVVLNEKVQTPREELVEDLLSITTVFSSRLYGMRSSKKTETDAKNDQD
jgi:predicted site-specific integrase-resolvase